MQRNFQKNATLDYWESGMDLGLSRDMFDSFLRYQGLLQLEFEMMQKKYGFTIVQADRDSAAVQRDLRRQISKLLGVK